MGAEEVSGDKSKQENVVQNSIDGDSTGNFVQAGLIYGDVNFYGQRTAPDPANRATFKAPQDVELSSPLTSTPDGRNKTVVWDNSVSILKLALVIALLELLAWFGSTVTHLQAGGSARMLIFGMLAAGGAFILLIGVIQLIIALVHFAWNIAVSAMLAVCIAFLSLGAGLGEAILAMHS